jgi:hypothetical protein
MIFGKDRRMTAAKALDLTVPPTLLATADEALVPLTVIMTL